MIELFLGPVIEKLINGCSDYLKDRVRWQKGMKPEMQKLQGNLIKIKTIVDASSQSQITGQNQDLMAWRLQLRDVIDEVDDLFDDFEYMKHEEKLVTENMKEAKKRSAPTSFLSEFCRKVRNVEGRALRIDPNLKRLEEVVQKLDNVLAEVGTFLQLVENTNQELQKQELELLKTRETGSLPRNDLIGRGEQVEFVMQWLKKPSNEDPTHITRSTLYKNISLLAIVGHGGMGKTTLLQHVYEDMKDEFDLKLWVCVSTDFDLKKVIVNMLEQSEKDASESLVVLQRNLKSMVQDKKFLLVLDDIWEKEDEGSDQNKWENVLSPLAHGSLGSKILITTRMDSAASKIAKVIGKKMITLKLEGLEEDECLKLFNTHAFADEDNTEYHKKLRHMAREIVKKLSGSPLAAKVIGAALNQNLDETHWRSVLNNDIGSAALGPNTIMPILRLSYAYLPKHLQCCFAFCSIFPQDHEFDKDDLVRMWISLGFIQAPSTSGVTMEDIGRRDAEEARSAKLNEKIYLTDLSLNFSISNIFTEIDLDEKVLENLQPPNNLRKLSISSYIGAKSPIWMNNANLISNLEEIKLENCSFWETLPPFEQLPFLKTLYLNNMPKVKRFNKFSGKDKFCAFRSLEGLRIRNLEALEEWFDAAGAPEDEFLFPCLTELWLEDCPNLPELPVFPPKLEKLRIVRIGLKALNWKRGINNCCSISKSIPLKKLTVNGCPNLTSLHLADETVRLEALRDFAILDCPNLISLGGLQDVETSENFKLILSDLSINDPSVLLMEPLRSIASIEKLDIIFNDKLVSFPSEAEEWFLQDRSSLRELDIMYLKSLQSLPSYLESLSSLKILRITDVPQLELLPNMPASLETLKLNRLQSLKCQLSSLSTLHNSSLKYLELCEIPLLKSLPDLPPSLKELRIYTCDPELRERYKMPSGSDLQKFAHIPDLKIMFD